MAKKLKAIVRLQLEAGKANPAPPVGPALAEPVPLTLANRMTKSLIAESCCMIIRCVTGL